MAQNWFNIDTTVMLNKQNKHQALDDIKESIAELNWYRQTIFKQEFDLKIRTRVHQQQIYTQINQELGLSCFCLIFYFCFRFWHK